MADHLRAELAGDALKMALPPGAVPWPGSCSTPTRGCQYTSGEYRQLLAAAEIRQSMGATGICFDKALVSYCTSWRWLGQSAFVDPASHAFDEAGVAGCGWLEEPYVLVV